MKKGHRLVVLPDYQGLGIGRLLLNTVADYWHKQGYTYHSVGSTKALYYTLKGQPGWKLVRKGRVSAPGRRADKAMARSMSYTRNTYSFRYVGKG